MYPEINEVNPSASIMVVDDQEDITRFLIKSLTRHYPEANVTGFTEGKKAIEWLGGHTPDIIITDLRMPECGGVEVITAAVGKNPRVPIIVISAQSHLEEFQAHAKQFDTVHFLPKPFMFHDLKELLERLGSIEPQSVIHGFRPISLLQVIQLENKSCRVDFEDHGKSGTLIFQMGELLRAETPGERGENALFEILSFRNPTIRLFNAPQRCELNIEKPLQALLLQYCQKTDERALARSS
jgi:CheY-like chemotaxis protein